VYWYIAVIHLLEPKMTTPRYEATPLGEFIKYLQQLDPKTVLFTEHRDMGETFEHPVNMRTIAYHADGWWNPQTGEYVCDDEHLKEEIDYVVENSLPRAKQPNAGFQKCPVLFIGSDDPNV
jgi:hypothetical protein